MTDLIQGVDMSHIFDGDQWNPIEHQHGTMESIVVDTSANSDRVKQLVLELYLANLNYRDAVTSVVKGKKKEISTGRTFQV